MKNKKGFTLVELLVVIAIIAILAAVVAPNAFKAIEKSKVTAIQADYRTIKTATLMYFSDTGVWPLDAADAEGFVTEPLPVDSVAGWNGPYVDVWQEESPLGTGYTFVNEDDATLAAACIDLTAPAVYLQIADLSERVRDILLADLGDTIVFSAATFDGVVSLKIADK